MKIFFITDSIYPYFKGGKEKRIHGLTTKLARLGHDVHIFTMKWWSGPKIVKKDKITLHAISRLYPLYNSKNKRRSIKQALFFGLKIIPALLKEKFDILEADQVPYFQLFPLKIITLIKRKKLIVSWLEVWGKKYWLNYLGWKGYFGYLIERISTHLPNKFVAISQLTKNNLIQQFQINPQKIIFIAPYGIDPQKFVNLQFAQPIDCIYFGRLLNHKNVNLLIEAIKLLKIKLPNIKCCIIGEGPEKNTLINLTKVYKLEQNITFLNFLEEKVLLSYINSAKVFVFPSTREGFGIAVLEANACGKPAIVINHPDNAAKDLVDHGFNGYISQFDKIDLAKQIEKALQSSDDKQIQQACLKRAQQYQWPKIIQQVLNLYQNNL